MTKVFVPQDSLKGAFVKRLNEEQKEQWCVWNKGDILECDVVEEGFSGKNMDYWVRVKVLDISEQPVSIRSCVIAETMEFDC